MKHKTFIGKIMIVGLVIIAILIVSFNILVSFL
jgi:hypothetical protein